MEMLSDTLLVEWVPNYKGVGKERMTRQKDKFIFFDLWVRNTLLGRQSTSSFGREELGGLFEQWIILQVIYYNRLFRKGWRISTYRDAMGVEVDLIIETDSECLAVEIKSSSRAQEKMFKVLIRFGEITGKDLKRYLIYQGEFAQHFDGLGQALPYRQFLDEVIPQLD